MEIPAEPIKDPFYANVRIVYKAGEESEYGPRDQNVLKMIVPWRGTRVLEPGAGDGRYTNPLLIQGNSVVATDIDLAALIALRDLKIPPELTPNLRLVKMDIFKGFPFGYGLFDNLLCTGTLYIFPPERLAWVFLEFGRVLRPEGYLALDFLTERETESLTDDPDEGKTIFNYSYEQGLQTLCSLLVRQFSIQEISETPINVILPKYKLRGRKINILAQRV